MVNIGTTSHSSVIPSDSSSSDPTSVIGLHGETIVSTLYWFEVQSVAVQLHLSMSRFGLAGELHTGGHCRRTDSLADALAVAVTCGKGKRNYIMKVI